MSSTSCGIATLIIAGVTNASFTMPMKYARKWAWENTWLAWTVFALVVLPLAAALVTIPNLPMVYRSASPNIILEVCGFGAGWGVARAGVMLCAAAGRMRERPSAQSISSQKRTSRGLLLAILCGLGASLMNFGVTFGDTVG
jgi:L-rhamnose-H+ transport protein